MEGWEEGGGIGGWRDGRVEGEGSGGREREGGRVWGIE